MDLATELKALIALSYKEDGSKDVTSEALCEDGVEKEAVIRAKQSGVISGLKYLDQIAQAIDENILIDPFLDDGDEVKDRMMIAGVTGDVKSLLRMERVLLNFLSRMSGISTLTREFVEAVDGTGAVILDTRKTVPGWRFLDKYAVDQGGGINHRMGLEDVALIKDTHVDTVGGVGEAIESFRAKDTDTPLIVEVRDLKECEEALKHVKSLARIILDNFDIDQMKEAVELASGKILLEASGGVNLDNARDIAETGVHFLSVGAITHSAPAFDCTFQITG